MAHALMPHWLVDVHGHCALVSTAAFRYVMRPSRGGVEMGA